MSEKSKSITFEVVGYNFQKKAGKGPVYKVSLKSSEGHSLTLVSDSKAIYEGFPIGDKVNVKISQAQQTLDVPEENAGE